jgi:hypothetical protein
VTLVSGRSRATERYAGLNDDDERGRSYRDVEMPSLLQPRSASPPKPLQPTREAAD